MDDRRLQRRKPKGGSFSEAAGQLVGKGGVWMLLAIAVGSTTTRLGVFQGERLVLQTSMGTDTRALADE